MELSPNNNFLPSNPTLAFFFSTPLARLSQFITPNSVPAHFLFLLVRQDYFCTGAVPCLTLSILCAIIRKQLPKIYPCWASSTTHRQVFGSKAQGPARIKNTDIYYYKLQSHTPSSWKKMKQLHVSFFFVILCCPTWLCYSFLFNISSWIFF